MNPLWRLSLMIRDVWLIPTWQCQCIVSMYLGLFKYIQILVNSLVMSGIFHLVILFKSVNGRIEKYWQWMDIPDCNPLSQIGGFHARIKGNAVQILVFCFWQDMHQQKALHHEGLYVLHSLLELQFYLYCGGPRSSVLRHCSGAMATECFPIDMTVYPLVYIVFIVLDDLNYFITMMGCGCIFTFQFNCHFREEFPHFLCN
jgi:hypothetical protein